MAHINIQILGFIKFFVCKVCLYTYTYVGEYREIHY